MWYSYAWEIMDAIPCRLLPVLMFDVETVFLFPWAVVVRDMGVQALVSVVFFIVILVLGLAYAWRKGALEWK
jgi:NADH-quinone oxidoreductase subunit A